LPPLPRRQGATCEGSWLGSWTAQVFLQPLRRRPQVSLSLRLKDLLGPVTRVKKEKQKKLAGELDSASPAVASEETPGSLHVIIVMIRWTGLAPWEFEFPFPGSLTSTFLGRGNT